MTEDVRTGSEVNPPPCEVAEPDALAEPREMTLDADDLTPEEAGYGYGV